MWWTAAQHLVFARTRAPNGGGGSSMSPLQHCYSPSPTSSCGVITSLAFSAFFAVVAAVYAGTAQLLGLPFRIFLKPLYIYGYKIANPLMSNAIFLLNPIFQATALLQFGARPPSTLPAHQQHLFFKPSCPFSGPHTCSHRRSESSSLISLIHLHRTCMAVSFMHRRKILAAAAAPLAGEQDAQLQLWDWTSACVLFSMQTTAKLHCLSISPMDTSMKGVGCDGRYVISVSCGCVPPASCLAKLFPHLFHPAFGTLPSTPTTTAPMEVDTVRPVLRI